MIRQRALEGALTGNVLASASELMRLHDGLRTMRGHFGSGVIMQVVRPCEAFRLERLARDGDHVAGAVLDLVVPVIRRLSSRPGRAPASCAACNRPIASMRFSVVVIAPFLSWPKNGQAVAVCQRCGLDTISVKAAVTRSCHAVWPAMPVIEQTHANGGRA